MYFSKNLVARLLTVVAVSGFLSNAQGASHLVVAKTSWSESRVMCAIIRVIAKNKWGYTSEERDYSQSKMHIVLKDGGNKNNGVDLACDLWPSLASDELEAISKGEIRHLGETGLDGQSGYYVPRYIVAGDYEETSQGVEPQVIEQVVPGEGRFLGCPKKAWGCGDTEKMKSVGFDSLVPRHLGDETAHEDAMYPHNQEIEKLWNAEYPFVAYSYRTQPIIKQLDLVRVTMPQGSDFPNDYSFHVGNNEFFDANKDLEKLVRNFNLPTDLINELVSQIETDKDGSPIDSSFLEVARDWVKDNSAVWTTWVQ